MRISKFICRNLFTALLLFAWFIAAPGLSSQASDLSTLRIEVVELQADFHADNTVIVVSGKIKNLNHHPLHGHLNIYLLDKNGNPIMAQEEPINRSSFAYGETISFESAINVANIKGISNISVEFVRQ